MTESTLIVQTQQSMFCRRCGHFGWTSDHTRCPDCGAPLQPSTTPGTVMLTNPPVLPSESTSGNSILPLKATVVLQFHPSGVCLSLPFHHRTILGRSSMPESDMLDLTPFDAYRLGVSRQHCSLERRNSRLVLIDLGSANGTCLNGLMVAPGQGCHVAHGDTLMLGRLCCTVRFHTSSKD